MKRVTKMELLNLKKDKSLLLRSINLLKDKRDSLIYKIVNSINKSRKMYADYSTAQDELVKVFKQLFIKYPFPLLKLESLNQPSVFNINASGFHFLNLTWEALTPDIDLSYFDSNFYILSDDDLSLLKEKMSAFIAQLCTFGTVFSNVSVFLKEVRKLTRRINFLEKTRLPAINRQINVLGKALDEFEREEMLRLKMIKKIIK